MRILDSTQSELFAMVGKEDPEWSYVVAPAHVRALCAAERSEEAQRIVDQVQAVADKFGSRCAGQARHLRLSSGGTDTFAASQAYHWQQRGGILRARLAAAIGAPDSEVLARLAEAGTRNWGKRYILDANSPEFRSFLRRMNTGEFRSPDDSAVWRALPPLMRSAGDNPLSPWTQVKHNDKLFYRKEAERTWWRRVRCGSPWDHQLEEPEQGVKQIAEVGMLDFDLSVDEWESTYADLGGPGNWSQERNFRYKLQTRGKSLLKKVAKVGIVLGVLFHLLVYIDCGDHGEPGIGSCTCFDGFESAWCTRHPTPQGWVRMHNLYCEHQCTTQECIDTEFDKLDISLANATKLCAADPSCVGVADGQCDGGPHILCDAIGVSEQGSCVYIPEGTLGVNATQCLPTSHVNGELSHHGCGRGLDVLVHGHDVAEFGFEDRDWCDTRDRAHVGAMGIGSDYCE